MNTNDTEILVSEKKPQWKITAILWFIASIISFLIPVVGWTFFTPIALLFWIYSANKWNKSGINIATLVIVLVNLIISPTVWTTIYMGEESLLKYLPIVYFVLSVVFLYFLVRKNSSEKENKLIKYTGIGLVFFALIIIASFAYNKSSTSIISEKIAPIQNNFSKLQPSAGTSSGDDLSSKKDKKKSSDFVLTNLWNGKYEVASYKIIHSDSISEIADKLGTSVSNIEVKMIPQRATFEWAVLQNIKDPAFKEKVAQFFSKIGEKDVTTDYDGDGLIMKYAIESSDTQKYQDVIKELSQYQKFSMTIK